MSESKSDVEGFANQRETRQILGNIGLSTLYAGLAETPSRFPKPYRLSGNRVGWKRSELRAWCESRPPVEYRASAKVGAR
jgi:predicted DNA-binding transcriptional regulator AlpA